jgi:branched-chain amino acid transport system substrate-binding protein
MKNVFLGCLLLGSLALAKENAAKNPIIIGEVNSYSGPASVFSNPYKVGMQMAIDEINQAGGIDGRTLQLVSKDDGLNPVESRKAAKELVLKEKADFLVGGLNGAACQALAEVAKENKKFFFATMCVLDPENGHGYNAHFARTVYVNTSLVGALAKRAIKEFPNAKKWSLIGANEASGKNIVGAFKRELKKLKPEVVFVNELAPQFGTTDYSSQITAISVSGADAVFSGLWGGDSITFTKQAKAFNLFKKMKYVGYSIGIMEESFAIGVDNIEGAISSGSPWWDADYQKAHPALMAWVGKFMKLNNNQPPGGGAFAGYQTVRLIASALRIAGSTEASKISSAIGKMKDEVLPWTTVKMRACDQVAYYSMPVGLISPVIADKKQSVLTKIEEVDGLEFAKPCSEVEKGLKK